MMIRVAVCDDMTDQVASIIALTKSYQTKRPGMEFDFNGFTTEASLLDSIDTETGYDIYLLDVIMPGIGGIELARQIQVRDSEASVVFLTNSTDHALDAFNVSAVQYIVKPINEELLFPVLDKIITARKQKADKFMLVSAADGSIVRVLHSSIIVIERAGRVMRFHLNNGEVLLSKTIRCPFEEAVAQVLQDKSFMHVHQSFVINMAHVRELHTWSFVMKNGVEVSIPRPKYTGIKNTYMDYLAESGI